MPSPTAMPARTGQRLRASQRAKPVWKTETYTDSQGSKTDGFQDDASTLVHSGRSGAIDGHHVRRKRGNRSRADQDRLFHALDRRPRLERQGNSRRVSNVGRGYQRPGRPSRPAGEAHHYDDQSNPSLVPAIYAKLFDIDKVDLVFTSYVTNLSVPSMPVVIPRN